MNYVKPRQLALLFVLALALVLPAMAQDATIVGTVTDPSGAAVPGVKITITNSATGQILRNVSNEAGQFVANALGVGKYTVAAEISGFKKFEQKDLILNVGDRARVDIALQVGETKESVNVEATAINVQADSGEISDVVTGTQVLNLSMNGRNLYELATLTPGAASALPAFNGPSAQGSSAIISFNGSRPDHNLFMVDGVSITDEYFNNSQSVAVFVYYGMR